VKTGHDLPLRRHHDHALRLGDDDRRTVTNVRSQVVDRLMDEISNRG
jgi:hypothetical protein